jgi:hypothetical protein
MTHPVYRHKAWRQVRPVILERDGYRCRIRGPRCNGTATEVDHIVPFEAGGAPYDPDNLRAACKTCNSGRASTTKATEGWRRSPTRITLVVGPPAAGKSTHVDQHRAPGDTTIDFDRIAESLGSDTSHGHDAGTVAAAQAARNGVLTRLRRGDLPGVAHVWLVSSNPKAEQMFPHHDVVVVDPGRDEVHRRAVHAGRPALWSTLIDQWYAARQVASSSRQW